MGGKEHEIKNTGGHNYQSKMLDICQIPYINCNLLLSAIVPLEKSIGSSE